MCGVCVVGVSVWMRFVHIPEVLVFAVSLSCTRVLWVCQCGCELYTYLRFLVFAVSLSCTRVCGCVSVDVSCTRT